MMWSESERPNKAKARRYLFSTTRFVSLRSLWLPAAEGCDLHLAFEMGLLDRNSQIIAVESDPIIYAAMCQMLDSLAAERQLAHRPIAINRYLHELSLDQPIDFAFLDLCGTCDADFLGWLQTGLAPKLLAGADLAITCTYAKRNSQFLQSCRDTLIHHWHDLYQQFCARHAFFDKYNDTREFEPLTVPAILLKCALHQFDVFMRRCWPYADEMPMIGYKLQDLRPDGDRIYPSFTDLMAKMSKIEHRRPNLLKPIPDVPVPKPVVPKPVVPRPPIVRKPAVPKVPLPIICPPSDIVDLAMRRSLAALKAHETRRRNNWIHPRTRAKLMT